MNIDYTLSGEFEKARKYQAWMWGYLPNIGYFLAFFLIIFISGR